MKNVTYIETDKLKPFENHPYKVKDDDEMINLTDSIKENGVLSPLIVRPIENDEYEIISGHRRLFASVKAGITEIPALIYDLDRDKAAITLVDSNLHRENILPSEKAFAYKLKMEAMSRQGQRTDLTLSQVATKFDAASEIGKQMNESRDQVFRYIRLTHLIPELLEYVDDGRIAFTPAVELSYLKEQEQFDLLETMESEERTPSLSQAIRIKKLSQENNLDIDKIFEIMSEEKANQKERIKITTDRLRKFFPQHYTITQIEETIIKLCENHYKKLQRKRSDYER